MPKVFKKYRKQCGKRRNCSLRAFFFFFSSFPTGFSKDLYCRRVKTRACFGKRLNSLSNEIMFDQSEFKAFADDNLNVAKMKPFVSDGLENTVGKAVYFRVIETRGNVDTL